MLSGMDKPLVDQIKSEMKQIDLNLEQQKKVIKNSLGNSLFSPPLSWSLRLSTPAGPYSRLR
jgi:hypothetical protein